MRAAAFVKQLRVLLVAQGSIEIGQGRTIILQLPEDQRTLTVDPRVFRIETRSRVEVCQGQFLSAGTAVSGRPAQIANDMERIEAQGLAIIGDGTFVFSLELAGRAATNVTRHATGGVLKRLGVIRDGLIQPSLKDQHVAACLIRQRGRRIEFQRPRKVGQGFL